MGAKAKPRALHVDVYFTHGSSTRKRKYLSENRKIAEY